MIATDYFDDRAGPAATTGMMTLPHYPLGSRQHAHHHVEWIRLVDNALAAKRLLATAKKGSAPARAETLIDMDMDEIPPRHQPPRFPSGTRQPAHMGDEWRHRRHMVDDSLATRPTATDT